MTDQELETTLKLSYYKDIPLILIGFTLAGLFIVAIPILAIIGVVVLLKRVAI